jgi:hypothetical protein
MQSVPALPRQTDMWHDGRNRKQAPWQDEARGLATLFSLQLYNQVLQAVHADIKVEMRMRHAMKPLSARCN